MDCQKLNVKKATFESESQKMAIQNAAFWTDEKIMAKLASLSKDKAKSM